MGNDSGSDQNPKQVARPAELIELAEMISRSDDVFVLADSSATILYANHPTPDPRILVELTRRQMPREMVAPSRWRGEIVVDQEGTTTTFDVQVVLTETTLAIHARDITSSTVLQQQLAHLASHDALTDLPNRALLLRRLADSLERARARQSHIAVLYVDIDDLKRINDSVGHECGDEVIAEIARRLVATTRPGDLVARIGGDEFVVLCEGVTDETTAADLADRLRIATTDRISILDKNIDTSVSIGVVLTAGFDSPQASVDIAQSLLDEADKAMYRAKSLGKSRSHVYTASMRSADRERARLVRDLEFAVERDELVVHYQSIISPHTRRTVAAEALVRWNHPELGLLFPSSFIDIALDRFSHGHDTRDPKRADSIDTWVLKRALSDLRNWIDSGRVDGRFAVHVNVSRSQMRPDFVETVLNGLSAAKLNPFNLVVEFNERLILDDDGRIVRTLQSLRRHGVRLSLDDFGAGTSSITSLRTCPVDFVKVDGSLVRGLAHDFVRSPGDGSDDESLVRTVIQLAHGVDASAIAESVTNAMQVDRLVALGCDLVQGFHIAEPLPAADFASSTDTVFPA